MKLKMVGIFLCGSLRGVARFPVSYVMDYKYCPYSPTIRKILSAFTFPLPYCTNMDSEAESSLLAPSTTVNSASTRLTRTRTAVATWAYACTALGTEPEYSGRNCILYCIHYPQELPYSSPVTNNF